MTREEAIRKLEYSKKAYQTLIDEKVDSGKLVGKDIKGEWEADTPLDEVYKSMIDALDMALKALEREPVYFPPCVDCNTKMNEIREAYDKLKNQEPCEDCISRQAVLKEIPALWNSKGDKDYCMETLRDFVAELPPVTVMAQQKTDTCEEKQKQTRDEEIINNIDFAIKATGSQDDYSLGMCNGMRYVKSLIDGKEPQYESRRTNEEKELGIDIGDEVIGDFGSKGVVVGIDTYKGDVVLSLLMGNHKVPQVVEASNYKTKTGRHFSQIAEVLEQMKGEADGK